MDSTAAFTTGDRNSRPRPRHPGAGATALGAAPHPAHRVGNALRAVRVFAEAAFGVVVLGEYAKEAGAGRP